MAEKFEDGGTRCIGGSTECHLSTTYNYAEVYRDYEVFPLSKEYDYSSIRWLYGRTAEETIPVLEEAVKKLGTRTFTDYWAPTKGNAGAALQRLLSFAYAHPDGVWDGD